MECGSSQGDVSDAVSKLKQETGDNILVYGSSTLVHTLMQHDLIDEYRLIVYPLILGEGERLFKDGAQKIDLEPMSATTTQKGVTLITYRKK